MEKGVKRLCMVEVKVTKYECGSYYFSFLSAGTPASSTTSTTAPTPAATPTPTPTPAAMSRPRGGHHHTSHHTSSSRKDILKHKDTKVRKWTKEPITFYTLEGNPIELGTWHSGNIHTYSL